MAVMVFRQLLCSVLGVERWHASALQRHPYRELIIARVRALQPDSLLEIGCGFGDIICNIRTRRRLGTDLSQRVLIGARLCHIWSWLVERVRFQSLRLGDRVDGNFEAIICVNFIHVIEPAALRSAIRALVTHNLAAGGTLVFDVVDNPQYRFNHDPAFLLDGLNMQWDRSDTFEFGRCIVFAVKG